MPLSQIQQQAILYTRLGKSEHLTPLIEQDSTLLECRDEDNNTLLLIALKYHDQVLAERLLQMGAKLNVANTKRMTPLHYAIKRNYFELARTMLLQPNGVQVNETNVKGESALMLLAQKGCLETAECLKSKYPDVNLKNQKGQTAFAIAIYFHQFDFADTLLHYMADINATDNEGNTALHTAVTMQDRAAIEFLAARGAAIQINNHEQLSPLDIVANQGLIELTELLRSCNKRDNATEPSLFLWAASKGYVSILRNLLAEEAQQSMAQIPSAPLVEVQDYDLHLALTASAAVVAAPVMHESLKADSIDKCHDSGVNVSHVNAQRLQGLVHQMNSEGDTALFLATKHKQEQVIQLLLEHHAEVNVFNYEGKTPLMIAVENYYAGVIRVLINGGADLSLCNTQGLTAARMAFNLESCKCALEFYRHVRALGQKIDESDINAQERKILSEIKEKHYIENPLIVAASQQQEYEVERLLNMGADVTDMDKQGRSALYHAASSHSLPMVTLLVQHGANVNDKTQQNDTAAMVAARQGHIELMEFLINNKANLLEKHSDGTTALDMALHHNQMIIAEIIFAHLVLLGHKIPAFKNEINKRKALMITGREYPIGLIEAAKRGDVVKASMLLEQGAVIHCRNAEKRTALFYALENRNHQMVQLLKDSGADINEEDPNGFTYAMCAARDGDLSHLKYLVSIGASVLAECELGNIPLFLAIHNKHTEVVSYLLDIEPQSIFHVNKEGWTAVFFAACKLQTDMISQLLALGAKENVTNIHGHTLLLHAAAHGLVEMLNERIARGDNLSVVDRQSKSALYLALEAKENSLACCKYLILAMNSKKIEIPIYLQSNPQVKKIEADIYNFKMYCLSHYRDAAPLEAILKFSNVEWPDTVLDEQDKTNIYHQVHSHLHILFSINAPIVCHIDNELIKLGPQHRVTINVLMVLDMLMLELAHKYAELSSEIIELALLKEAKNISSELHLALKGNAGMSFFANNKGRNRSLSLEKIVSTVTTNALKENVHTAAITGTSNFSLLGEGHITDEILKRNLLERLRLDFSNAQHREFWASKVNGGGGVLCEGVRVPNTISKLREHVATYSTANYASLLSSLKDILREEDQKAKIGSFFSGKYMIRSYEVNKLIRECENLERIDFSVERNVLDLHRYKN